MKELQVIKDISIGIMDKDNFYTALKIKGQLSSIHYYGTLISAVQNGITRATNNKALDGEINTINEYVAEIKGLWAEIAKRLSI